MGTSLYDLTIPVFIRSLTNLNAILAKGEAWAIQKGIDPADLLATRLVEDMHPLPYQVQRACDSAKSLPVRVGAIENRAFPDEEKTFADLQARIAGVIAFLRKVQPAAMEGLEEKAVSLDLPDGRSIPFTGRTIALNFAIPNFFFHVTMSYALLRHQGVPVGKLDYLGGV
jgi:hypothetical protein